MTEQRDVLSEIMSRPVVTIGGGKTVADALRVMAERRIGAVVVAEDGRPAGIFTERDLVNHLLDDGDLLARSLDETMSSPLVTATPDTPIDVAFELMRERDIRRLPVVEDGALLGIVTERDLMGWVDRVAHAPAPSD